VELLEEEVQETEEEEEEETAAAAAAENLAEADWAAAASNRCKTHTTQVRPEEGTVEEGPEAARAMVGLVAVAMALAEMAAAETEEAQMVAEEVLEVEVVAPKVASEEENADTHTCKAGLYRTVRQHQCRTCRLPLQTQDLPTDWQSRSQSQTRAPKHRRCSRVLENKVCASHDRLLATSENSQHL
jgi:hypothetical protein